ncbi:hypothetical protein [Hydrogenophaga sp. OTU3427]|uniref:hypothetical protein n=1 Tax=Hydrogenophaga sp. OTU3427 TaxID=3043856 RepID=UPI00313AEE6F
MDYKTATGATMLQKISYPQLNSRQQENYNFQKVSACLADYGFNCLRLTDDWHGADFLACHIDGETFLKVQLKGRLTVDKKYMGKNIYIAFSDGRTWYLYPHDPVVKHLFEAGLVKGSRSWEDEGHYSWPSLSQAVVSVIGRYALG